VTCAEFQQLAALLALGTLDEAERAAAEAHLAEHQHEGCFEALQKANAAVGLLSRTLPPERPPDRAWRAIEARLEASPARRMGLRERVAWGAAAAAFLLAAGAALWQRADAARASAALAAASRDKLACLRELSSLRDDAGALQAAIALLQSPTTAVVTLQPQPGAPAYAARALVDLAAGKGMILSSALAPPSGRDLQLWVIRGKQAPIPAGLLRGGPSGAVLASIDPGTLGGGVDALAVSIEPRGGSPTGQPTGAVVLVGALPKS
jgi:anti-sigma-K factor RskA